MSTGRTSAFFSESSGISILAFTNIEVHENQTSHRSVNVNKSKCNGYGIL